MYHIANKYRTYNNYEDLVQAGFKGLVEAYNKFDPKKGKFSSYAYLYILGEILNEINQNKIIKQSKELYTLRKKILKVKDKLIQKLKYIPTNKEISKYLNIPLNIIDDALKDYTFESLENEEIPYEELIQDKTYDKEQMIYLKEEINKLKEPDKSIIIKRYFEDLTEIETAKQLNLSQVTVSRHEKKVLTKLRSI